MIPPSQGPGRSFISNLPPIAEVSEDMDWIDLVPSGLQPKDWIDLVPSKAQSENNINLHLEVDTSFAPQSLYDQVSFSDRLNWHNGTSIQVCTLNEKHQLTAIHTIAFHEFSNQPEIELQLEKDTHELRVSAAHISLVDDAIPVALTTFTRLSSTTKSAKLTFYPVLNNVNDSFKAPFRVYPTFTHFNDSPAKLPTYGYLAEQKESAFGPFWIPRSDTRLYPLKLPQ